MNPIDFEKQFADDGRPRPPQQQAATFIHACNVAAERMTDHPQEHESLDQFIEKVEASGEDKKHEAFDKATFLSMAWIAGFYYYDMHDVDGVDLGENLECDKFGATDRLVAALAEYTQAQRDAYAAEAVKQERERIMAVLKERLETFEGLAMHFYERSMPEVATRDAAVASQLEYIISLLKGQP